MTVKELIEKLQEMPQDVEVKLLNDGWIYKPVNRVDLEKHNPAYGETEDTVLIES